jgi:thioredoxin-dependent peroxiredoxin
MVRCLSAAVCGILALGVSLSWGAEPLKVGDMAPNFEMVGSDGKTYKLSDFRDKKAVVVAWYPRAFTGGCTRECISLRENGEKLRQFEVAYFTASCDPVDKNTEFAKSLELDYPILSDPDGKVASQYGIYNPERNASSRTTFVIGKDGRILQIDSEVQVGEHGADIAQALAKLGVAKRTE